MDDITFCLSECKQTDCFRHPSNIQDRTIPHSYADFTETETCPEFAKDINAPIDDLISRQAVINEMKDMYTAAEEWAQGAHDDDTRARAESCMATNVELKLRIEKLPSAQPRWIPVTGALPEKGKEVLVTRDYDGRKDYNKSCRYVETASRYGEDDDVVWSSYSDEYKMYPKSHRVVAWMPLPEPYKGGQDE